MTATVVTFFQLFGLGFALGLSGPCVLFCLPPMLMVFGAAGRDSVGNLVYALLFLTGRLVSYTALGAAAGISAAGLRSLVEPPVANWVDPVGASALIILGIFLALRRGGRDHCKSTIRKDLPEGIALFVFGLSVGLAPCPPLIALMSEIMLAAGSILEGLIFGLAFGLGTFFAGLALLASTGHLVTQVPRLGFLRSENFRVWTARIGGGLLASYGGWMLARALL